jgi:uncharacterized protein (DUF2141 family)
MKKTMFSSALLFLFLPVVVVAAAADQHGQIRIEVAGLASDQGTVNIALIASAEEFVAGGDYFRQVRLPLQNRHATWLLTGIPFGEYAVKLYQDKNRNGKLDTVPLLGIPLEPYGFSNNARSAFGPPSYRAARFSVNQPETTLVIIAK